MEASQDLQLSIDYPDRQLNRWTTFLRPLVTIPIGIVLANVAGSVWQGSYNGGKTVLGFAGAGGLLVIAPLLMIVFRQKYPRWWFDWNLELLRFMNRVAAYLALTDDRYPSTDEEQSVHLTINYPEVKRDLNRWLPLVKWFLAIPHYLVLAFLTLAAFFVVIFAWVAIIFSGHYPRGLFDFVEGVIRWHDRVVAYSIILTTDAYPPFRLAA